MLSFMVQRIVFSAVKAIVYIFMFQTQSSYNRLNYHRLLGRIEINPTQILCLEYILSNNVYPLKSHFSYRKYGVGCMGTYCLHRTNIPSPGHRQNKCLLISFAKQKTGWPGLSSSSHKATALSSVCPSIYLFSHLS